MYDIITTNSVPNDNDIGEYVEKFLHDDFGIITTYPDASGVVKALLHSRMRRTLNIAMKFKDGIHNTSAIGAYPYHVTDMIFVIYDKELADFNNDENTLLVAMLKDFNELAADPLQDLINRVTYNEIQNRWKKS